jgi:uncharacterized protein (TIGR02145 family)
MAIPENDNQLWKGFGHGLYSKRAERDVDGLVIDQTYAKKADVPALDNALSTSTTTAITPKAVKDVIAEVDVIPTLPQTPSSLYSETSGSMTWGGWESDDVDVPEKTITVGGKEYKIVTIGTQQWMAENLAYLGSINFPETAKPQYASATYPKVDGQYITRFGYLYNNLALDALTTVAPSGWHIPTVSDVTTLETYVSTHIAGTQATSVADALKSALSTDWNYSDTGSDIYAFKADAPGYFAANRYYNTNTYINYLSAVRYWCTFDTWQNTPYFGIDSSTTNTLVRNTNGYYTDFFSVRFVKNLA